MGVKHFFIWLRKHFGNSILELPLGKKLTSKIDNLCIDMNGIFHPCAQQVCEYGEYKKPPSLLRPRYKKRNTLKQRLTIFKKVCNRINFYIKLTNPQKRLILCIDGIAGAAKMSQQRQRRFKSAKERNENMEFDPNCMSPGTKFLDHLSKYIDWYIRTMLSYHPEWEHLEIILSNEKVAGEGEHKIISYLRKYGNPSESYCIQGLDADLIMLGLGSPMPEIYILRENYHKSKGFYVVDIKAIREHLLVKLRWEGEGAFRKETAINDFIFLCFLVGNDFLPTIPTLAILENGIDILLDVYNTTCGVHGHLTGRKRKSGVITLRSKSLQVYLAALAEYEKGLVVDKANKTESFFPDLLVQKHLIQIEGGYDINYDGYTNDFYNTKFPQTTVKTICQEYLKGMQWVITYYKQGIPDWRWKYPYNYGPFIADLSEHLKTYKSVDFDLHSPVTSFEQLLCILPPKSKKLVPEPLNSIFDQPKLQHFYPEEFKIDLSGKRREWEGIVLLPMINLDIIHQYYKRLIISVKSREERRNKVGKSYIYTKSSEIFFFKSFYGDIPECSVNTKIIQL